MPSINLPQRGMQVATDGARPADLHGPSRGLQGVAAGTSVVTVRARCTPTSIIACSTSAPAVLGVQPSHGAFDVTFETPAPSYLNIYWCIL